MKQLHEFTSVDWISLYGKTKVKKRIGVVGDMLEAVGNCIVALQGRSSITPFVRAVDVVAQKMAVLGDIKKGWRLHENWFRQLFAQIVNHQNTMNMYLELGWNFDECASFTWNRTTTLDTFDVRNASTGEIDSFKMLFVATGEYPHGSVWRASSGKMWELLDIEKGGVVHMVSEEKDSNGNYVEQRFPISLVSTWERVREVE